MNIRFGWMALALTFVLLFVAGTASAEELSVAGTDETLIVDDIEPYSGPIGPASPLYGLKIAFEDLDESFTTNDTERFNKHLNNARLRLSEAREQLQLNNTDAADRALDLYLQNTNTTQQRLQVFGTSNATSLLHAQEMVARHQLVLANLLDAHPNNTGLMRAYNNSLALENKFQEKTQTRFEKVIQKNNAMVVKAVRLEVMEQQNTRNTGQNQTLRVQQTQVIRQGTGNGNDDNKGQSRVTATQSTTGQQNVQTTVSVAPTRETNNYGKGNSGTGNSASNGDRNGNSGNSGTTPTPGTGSGKNR